MTRRGVPTAPAAVGRPEGIDLDKPSWRQSYRTLVTPKTVGLFDNSRGGSSAKTERLSKRFRPPVNLPARISQVCQLRPSQIDPAWPVGAAGCRECILMQKAASNVKLSAGTLNTDEEQGVAHSPQQP